MLGAEFMPGSQCYFWAAAYVRAAFDRRKFKQLKAQVNTGSRPSLAHWRALPGDSDLNH
jgi:hypothetical protein